MWNSAVEAFCGVWKESFSSQESGKSFWAYGNSQHLQSVRTVFSSPQTLQVFVWPFMGRDLLFPSWFSKWMLASRNTMPVWELTLTWWWPKSQLLNLWHPMVCPSCQPPKAGCLPCLPSYQEWEHRDTVLIGAIDCCINFERRCQKATFRSRK